MSFETVNNLPKTIPFDSVSEKSEGTQVNGKKYVQVPTTQNQNEASCAYRMIFLSRFLANPMLGIADTLNK